VSYFPRPGGFVQSLRLRRRALPGNVPIVVVEGTTDRSAIFPFLESNVVVIPGNGKDQVLRAFSDLEPSLRHGVLFIVDCDGGVDPFFKGHLELVISANRDIEADLLFELGALERVALSILSTVAANPQDAVETAHSLLVSASMVAVGFGVIRTAAQSASLPVRVLDARTGLRRRLTVFDAPSVVGAPVHDSAEAVAELLREMGSLLKWSGSDQTSVAELTHQILRTPCTLHGSSTCLVCQQNRYCGGHDLVESLSLFLRIRHNIRLPASDLDRDLRIAADRSRLSSWRVVQRGRSAR